MRLNNVEIEILKGRLAEGYEWITRNYEDKIMFHIKYPKPDIGWYGKENYSYSNYDFKFISQADEPYNICELLNTDKE